MSKIIYLCTALLLASAALYGDAAAGSEGLNYFAPLTREERESIHYIITSLSTKSMFSLLGCRKQLESAGARIKNVNPLRFWKEVLTQENLKSGLPHIGSIAKSQLIKDFATSFAFAGKQGKIGRETIDDFAESTGISKELLINFAREGRWQELTRQLIR